MKEVVVETEPEPETEPKAAAPVAEPAAEPAPAKEPAEAKVEFKAGSVRKGVAYDANGGNINLRMLPSADAFAAGAVASGTELKVKALTDVQPDGFAWYQVEYAGEIVYIRSDLIIINE